MSSKNRKFNFIDGNGAIQNNQAFQFSQRHALNIYNKRAIYTFIPKNACTSLRASLAVENGFLEETKLSNQINWVHNNTYTFSANIRELITADYTFTILRCPYDRLASMFLDKFVDKTPVAWNFYRQSNNKFDLDKLTFNEFVNHLKQNPSLLTGDIHWRKQTDFLVYQNYDDYFDFSNFSEIESTLKSRINLKLIDARNLTNHGREKHNKTDNNNDYSNTCVEEILELKSKKILPSTEQLLTNNIKTTINKLYEKDFVIRQSLSM